MSSEISGHVFYPLHLDLERPIHTVFRQITREMASTVQVTGLVTKATSPITEHLTTVHTIPVSVNTIFKAVSYIDAFTEAFDIVHTGPSRRNFGALLSSLRGAKIVHTFHAAPDDTETRVRQRLLAEQADAVTATTPYLKEWAKTELGYTGDITVVPNGIDLDTFHPNNAQTQDGVYLFAGRLIPQKHPELLLDIAQEFPDATFKICGNGKLRQELETQAPPNVKILERIPRSTLANYYAEASAILCPYEREGFGMVALEALASGTPVIGYNDGNLPYLLGDSGIICDSLTTAEWAAAIDTIRGGQQLFTPRDRAQEYAWPRIARQYTAIYNDLF